MKRPGEFRNDLVIGMTLAEIFLLILFVVWYGSRLESEERASRPQSPAEVLRKELEKARAALDDSERMRRQLQADIRELERILDWLGQRLGTPGPIRSTGDADTAVRNYASVLRRGKAACENPNVLLDVIARDDFTTATLRRAFAFGDRSYPAGAMLSNGELTEFFARLTSYYADRSNQKMDCAFDYSLSWKTDRDYRMAKKRFEAYFYPAGDRQLQ